ncbi:MAG: type I restriction endonuclease subunit R, partial [Shewanellaceae bacterium]|nr:type I restriction endonuclease subunit R [Shewanellaceae bacterium]
LQTQFPDADKIETEQDKKAFAKLFGEYLKVENILQNYDEFTGLKALQKVDLTDPEAVTAFKSTYYLDDDAIDQLKNIPMPSERLIQDYRSTYNDTRDWLRRQRASQEQSESTLDWDDVVFEVDLLKSQEINLDFILELIFEQNKKNPSKEGLIDEVRRHVRASLGNRAKESLVVDFIQRTDLDAMADKANIIDEFFKFAQQEQQQEVEQLIQAENLNPEPLKRYLEISLKNEYASENGTALNEALPKLSPLNPKFRTLKQIIFQKITELVEKYKGIGGDL